MHGCFYTGLIAWGYTAVLRKDERIEVKPVTPYPMDHRLNQQRLQTVKSYDFFLFCSVYGEVRYVWELNLNE